MVRVPEIILRPTLCRNATNLAHAASIASLIRWFVFCRCKSRNTRSGCEGLCQVGKKIVHAVGLTLTVETIHAAFVVIQMAGCLELEMISHWSFTARTISCYP